MINEIQGGGKFSLLRLVVEFCFSEEQNIPSLFSIRVQSDLKISKPSHVAPLRKPP